MGFLLCRHSSVHLLLDTLPVYPYMNSYACTGHPRQSGVYDGTNAHGGIRLLAALPRPDTCLCLSDHL